MRFCTRYAAALLHAHEPGWGAYFIREIGVVQDDEGVAAVDAAYAELVERGYLELDPEFTRLIPRNFKRLPDGTFTDSSGRVVKPPFRLTVAGQRAKAERAAAPDRCGPPPGLTALPPAWRTDTAVALARQMDESRDFSAMPILADALQDAGCDNDDILDHCRGPGPHVRGCWVVDLVLGKE
jgi:hypothetical protein